MEILSNKIIPGDFERSRRDGLFNSIDGSTYGTQAETDLADERHQTGRSGDLSLSPIPSGEFPSEDGNRYETGAEANLATEYHLIATAQAAQRNNAQGQA